MNRSGFTLIEVLVAVAILSVAAMAILNLGIQSTQLGDRLKKKEALILRGMSRLCGSSVSIPPRKTWKK